MKIHTAFLALCVLCLGVAALVEDLVDDKAEGTKFTQLDLASGKEANSLRVSDVTEEDNLPTPKGAKEPLDPHGKAAENLNEPYDSFIMSVSMIVVSEIGDKTFLIAALMAMKQSRLVVFTAAFSSLVVMTILSGIVGHALPSLISKRLTQFLASILFIVFGAKLLKEGLSMSKNMGVEDELAEVEEEIQASSINHQLDSAERGGAPAQRKWYDDAVDNVKNLAGFVLSPVFIQVFVMTFLGEWGDRSQIATIALAAGSDYWFVIIGAIVGHGLCTCAACVGGKLLAKKISMRNVTLGGSIAFFVFAILYFYEAYYDVES